MATTPYINPYLDAMGEGSVGGAAGLGAAGAGWGKMKGWLSGLKKEFGIDLGSLKKYQGLIKGLAALYVLQTGLDFMGQQRAVSQQAGAAESQMEAQAAMSRIAPEEQLSQLLLQRQMAKTQGIEQAALQSRFASETTAAATGYEDPYMSLPSFRSPI